MSHVEYVEGTDRRTDRPTGTRPLHYSFRYGLDQRNKSASSV